MAKTVNSLIVSGLLVLVLCLEGIRMDTSEAVEGLETAHLTLDALKEVGEFANNNALGKLLKRIPVIGSVLAVIGNILSWIEPDQPDEVTEAMLQGLSDLKQSVKYLITHINEMEKRQEWESTRLYYSQIATRLELDMEFTLAIGQNNHDSAAIKRDQDRLLERCHSHRIVDDVTSLLNGVTDRNVLQANILEMYYTYSNGNRPELSKLIGQILQLQAGGIIAIMACEIIKRGKEGAVEMESYFNEKLAKVPDKMNAILQRCIDEFPDNMQGDLDRAITNYESQSSREEFWRTLQKEIQTKYDWLYVTCLVYDDITGFDKHAFFGRFVEKLHENDINAVCFYVDANASFPTKAIQLVGKGVVDESEHIADAKEACCHIEAKLNTYRIGWSGIACIKHSAHLLANNGTDVIRRDGPHNSGLIFLRYHKVYSSTIVECSGLLPTLDDRVLWVAILYLLSNSWGYIAD